MTETGPAANALRSPQTPTATYRVQLSPSQDFDAVARRVPYLAALGVSHLYLSPVLQAAPGSDHGYDVVDHGQIWSELGGRDGLQRLGDAARQHDLGVVVDVVPNHMAVPTPAWHNQALWSVLRHGPDSPHAEWFDIDWKAPGRSLLMPVLGDPIGAVLAAGELTVDDAGDEVVVRYHEHVFPVRPGTEHLPLEKLLEQQWYRLAWWRIADEELNYRRFFDVDTLAGLRVERPRVFDATHRLTLDLVRDGIVDGLRIDHPDGLTDPDGYLRRLTEAAPQAWIVVEKILAEGEELPPSWHCHGTTGYEALNAVNGLFIDSAGYGAMVGAYPERTGADLRFATTAAAAKTEVLDTVLAAEVERLVDLAARICALETALHDHSRRALHETIVALLVAMEQYRIYVRPGDGPAADELAVSLMADATEAARSSLPVHRHGTLDLIADLALLRRGEGPLHSELCTRLQQASVAATAKGVEDTALYRWMPMAGANEVGGDPSDPATSPEGFHAFAARIHQTHPATMTTLSTHDTKRGEDTRARLAVLTEVPDRWAEVVDEWHESTATVRSTVGPDRIDEELVWQTLVGLWPMGDDVDQDRAELAGRVKAYLVKAMREAKRHTSWVEPHDHYESAVGAFCDAVLADDSLAEGISGFVAEIAPAARANGLGQKLVQLTMPGVPDIYQGAELEWLAVVDPDNRRPIDHDRCTVALAHLEAGGHPRDISDEKLLVTAAAVRLRHEHPEWFDHRGEYEPLMTSTDHLVAFSRGGHVAVVASRLVATDPDLGRATLALPAGRWSNLLHTGAPIVADGSPVPVAGCLGHLPVALLVREVDGAAP